jgi:hypothetical protein
MELFPPCSVMDTDRKLWIIFLATLLLLVVSMRLTRQREAFASFDLDMQTLTTQALDAAPTTTEVKKHYKTLLIYADSDIRNQGTKALRLLADFRDRVYGPRNFRAALKVEDVLANWPSWMEPLDTTITEPVPPVTDAVNAELRMLAYLQKYFPEEPNLDEQTGSTIRNLIEDFGYRFVFERGVETVALRPDFLQQPLVHNWVNPAAVV